MIYNANVEKEREREREKEKTSLMWGFWSVKFLPKVATNQNISTKPMDTIIKHKKEQNITNMQASEALEHLARRENDEDCPGHGNEWTKPMGAKRHRGVSKLV